MGGGHCQRALEKAGRSFHLDKPSRLSCCTDSGPPFRQNVGPRRAASSVAFTAQPPTNEWWENEADTGLGSYLSRPERSSPYQN